ncbi:MAG: TRAM domain-containing protein [Nitrospirae bacterium]|nr:TRAM domain-containing protein [Nitrospirota bacterium]
MITAIRVIFLIVAAVSGQVIFSDMELLQGQWVPGAVVGLAVGLLAIVFENYVRRVPVRSLTGAIIGLASGILLAALVTLPIKGLHIHPDFIGASRFLVFAVLGYLGLAFGARKGSEFDLKRTMDAFKAAESQENIKLLDTSVIIDGRIADICETGFIEGVFMIPQFILHELQHIADSSDPMKRARGRRGLDILHRIQKISGLDVRVVDDDFPKIREVDAKLVALAKAKGGKVVTNDFNLNKVAALQGVTVLNINDLSNAVKPVVLPGEAMRVFVLKEGKEFGQGVGYLDDGTMIVVENGRKQIGRNVDVSVTSVLQTTAGRMIFTRLKDEQVPEDLHAVHVG